MNNSDIIREVRNRSHASLALCAKAVDEAGGDVEKALKILQEKGVIQAAGRARVATEGRVQVYEHQGAKISVVVEINCETDFAARSEPFKAFCDIVAMQIAATNPRWTRRSEIPADALANQQGIFEAQLKTEGKPEKVWPRILEGKIEKWKAENCLEEQKAMASETPTDTVELLRAGLSSKLGETVTIRRFVRWEVGEGIEKPAAVDYVAEVARMAAV